MYHKDSTARHGTAQRTQPSKHQRDTHRCFFLSRLGWYIPGLSDLQYERRLLLVLAERSSFSLFFFDFFLYFFLVFSVVSWFFNCLFPSNLVCQLDFRLWSFCRFPCILILCSFISRLFNCFVQKLVSANSIFDLFVHLVFTGTRYLFIFGVCGCWIRRIIIPGHSGAQLSSSAQLSSAQQRSVHPYCRSERDIASKHTTQHRATSFAQVPLGNMNSLVASNHGPFLPAPFTSVVFFLARA